VSAARKMAVFEQPGDRVLVLLAAGNLALTQAVMQLLSEPAPEDKTTLYNVASMAEAARLVGDAVREVHRRDAATLAEFNVDFNCSFILGGQIRGANTRLFMIYSAGNFVESSQVSPYFQIGESKYGKPIIDRVVTPATPLDEVAKCALVSMDSTLRSNLSVGLPLDLLVYEKDALQVTRFSTIDNDNHYFQMIHRTWGERLRQIFGEIPNPTWADPANVPLRARETVSNVPRVTGSELRAEPDTSAPPFQTLMQPESGQSQH
jgi:putative proteasome-type protease